MDLYARNNNPQPNVSRADGTWWESTWDQDDFSFMADYFLKGKFSFLFVRLKKNPDRHWWCKWRPEWVRTDDVWKGYSPISDHGFRVIDNSK